MKKITKIDFGGDRLISLAADLVDNHNYIGALKILNKNADLNGDDEDSLSLYAEIFDDMGLYEKCVNGWFRFMDEADFSDMSDCYEGLAVSFMNLGDEHFSAYYYNKLLSESDGLEGDAREEILSDFMGEEDNPLKFSYPPALEDCSQYISDGIGHMKEGEYDLAIEDFEKVKEGNPRYLSARNYVAMCKIISDRTEEAEQECLKVLEKYPDDVQALTTLAAVKTEAGKRDEALVLAKKLLESDVDDPDSLYKIATVCCENNLHEEAYFIFKKLTGDLEYDLNIMYFKAVAAFNCGRYEESFSAFDDLCTVYPDAVTARYHYRLARQMVAGGFVNGDGNKNGVADECAEENACADGGVDRNKKKGDEPRELSYFYRLPNDLRESSLKLLAAYMRLSGADAKKLVSKVDISECVLWCFDEMEGSGATELQLLAAQVAVKAELDGIVRDILLNAFLNDGLKIEILTALAERNEFDCFGLVICNVYKRVTTAALEVGRLRKKYFVQAYARLVAHFSVLDDGYGTEFANAAENFYKKLADAGRLGEVKNVDALAAAVYILSGIDVAGISDGKIYGFFDVTKEQVDKLLGEL